ncbi:MAG TPA: futalosine hydrolase [Natronosporangium sp.]|nr:futalosine hydrolase [Natronosporangium sp.]
MSVRVLVTTSVIAERDAVLAGLPAGAALVTGPDPEPPPSTGPDITVGTVGVGPAAAAARTARLLGLAEAAGRPYQVVISAGIAGGFPDRAPIGATVLARRSVHADLGAESPDGWQSLDQLGFGSTVLTVDPSVLAALTAALPEAVLGDVLTVTTVTGTAERAATLAARHPEAVAEGMEGYGVGCAAADAGVRYGELRTISNPVGPRDRAAWRIGEALDALTAAASALTRLVSLADAG